MLYSNIDKYTEKREMSFGPLKGITLGERGEKKFEQFIPTFIKRNVIEKDMVHKYLTVNYTSGNLKIVVKYDESLYLLLSSYGNIEKLKHGGIYTFHTDFYNHDFLCGGYSNGYVGERVCWDEVLIKINTPETTTFMVKYSGTCEDEIYVVNGKNVYRSKFSDGKRLREIYESLNMDIPFTHTDDNKTFCREWNRIY